MTMKLLITGANGFLGNYVVGESLRRGHTVRALVRPSTDVTKTPWAAKEGVELVRADLSSLEGLADIVRGVDCVIHLAAAKTGDTYTQYEGTVVTTENLLSAMNEAGVRRLVAVSSFSVYDYTRAGRLSTLDEQSPLEVDGSERDVYAHTKLVQEQVIRDHASREGFELVVLRPGMIWGKDHLLNAWVGFGVGRRLWVRTGARARIPATYVENCAEAVVQAADSTAGWGQIFNVVDDDLPTQRQFLRMALRVLTSPPAIVPVPYTLLRLAAGTVELMNKHLLRSRARVPGILVPCRLHARAKPLEYSNRKIKEVLGWSPRYALAEGFGRSISSESQDSDAKAMAAGSPLAAASS